jgi:hypothetical protein
MTFEELLKKIDDEPVPCVIMTWEEEVVEKRNCRAVLVSDKCIILEYEDKDALDCSSWKKSDCLDPNPNDWRYIAVLHMYLLEKATKEYLFARMPAPVLSSSAPSTLTNPTVASLFEAVNARLGVSVPAGDSMRLLLQSLSIRIGNLVHAYSSEEYPESMEVERAGIRDHCISIASVLVSIWHNLGASSR